MDIKLGKLEELNLRTVWKNEAYDFTKWLASEENIAMINDTIGLSLTDVKVEQPVGKYSCDIVAKDEITEKTIIIENQLEATNHDHLGKIITYASGLKATVVIWIAKQANSEHASAIEWLNEHTDDDISFFLLEAHLWKINDSEPALKFEIIEQPNNFEKQIKKMSKNSISETESKRLEFWEKFNEVMEERKEFNIRKPSTDHWYDFAIGTSSCHLSCELLNNENKVRINLWIPPYNSNAKILFDDLKSHKAEIEEKIGSTLNWLRMDNKKACRICKYINGLDFNKPEEYYDLSNSIIDLLVKFRDAFKPYL